MEESTHFAPAERSSAEQLLRESGLVASHKLFSEIFGAMAGIGGVINKNRQIVYANNELLMLLGINSLEPILGKRPGEFISCIHSAEEKSGCGTSNACAYCGAVNAILESQRTGMKVMNETHISALVEGKHKSWDLNVISTPVSFAGEEFYILVLQDISERKRKAIMERIFFHDLLNSVGGLNGLLTILKEGIYPEQTSELITLSEEASRDILEEIHIQRQIRDAENGELVTKIEMTNSLDLLDSALGKVSYHKVGKDKKIIKAEDSVNIDFETDRVLLQRVIINLVKNALEETESGGTVHIGVSYEDEKLLYWVKNDQVIPNDVQLQLFQRSYSTKGDGRGLGTYSIRLLTENYLGGKVSFISNHIEGTVFTIELNRKFPVINS